MTTRADKWLSGDHRERIDDTRKDLTSISSDMNWLASQLDQYARQDTVDAVKKVETLLDEARRILFEIS